MTKFCIVAPPQILYALDERGIMGEHHLLLAHDVVAKPSMYHQLFDRFGSRMQWKDELIILDNSAVELGKAVDMKMMADAIDIVDPTVVVLPDVLLDGEATARSCLDALDTWPNYLPTYTKYCYIPQGKRVTEFIASARAIPDDSRITFWGCPRNVVRYHGTRATAIECLLEINPTRRIHMMGFSDNIQDDIDVARRSRPFSIDSAVPLRLKHPLRPGCQTGTRGDWWENGLFTAFTQQNLEVARAWFA